MGHLGRLQRKNPDIVYGFMGCMAQSRGPELIKTVPHLDLVVGTQKYHRVVDHVESIIRRREDARMDDLRISIVDTEEETDSQNTIRDHLSEDNKVSEFVSIMQGCNMKCSFCIVPSTRGEERARPIDQIVEEVRRLVDVGVKEVTLKQPVFSLDLILPDGKWASLGSIKGASITFPITGESKEATRTYFADFKSQIPLTDLNAYLRDGATTATRVRLLGHAEMTVGSDGKSEFTKKNLKLELGGRLALSPDFKAIEVSDAARVPKIGRQ